MKTLGWLLIALLSLLVAVVALASYTLLPLGANLPDVMRLSFLSHKTVVYTHIFSAVIALLLGPVQLLPAVRRRFPKFHRVCGRLYLGVGVLIGGTAGLYMSAFAFGGPVAKAGFAGLAVSWLYTGWRAFQTIRQGRVDEHRRWVLRNFALTFAAVMLRLYLPLSGVAGIAFGQAYPFIAWLCWVPNLVFVERVFNRRRSIATPRRGAVQLPS